MREIENVYIRELLKFIEMYRILFFLFFISFSLAQQTDKVDFIKCDASVSPYASEKSIYGDVVYEFKVKKAIDTIKIDAKNMEFSGVMINGKSVKFKNSGKTLDLFEGFKKGKNKLRLNYSAKPLQTLYFTGEGENLQIWTQGQGRYTSHWLPSFDDVNEKVIFNILISDVNPYLKVISNGLLKRKPEVMYMDYDAFEMQKPMSSYLVMLSIGNFEKQTAKTKSRTPLEFYVDKKDISKFEPTYRYSKEMFNYLEKEIGVKYPWGIYRQVPVRDFLYAGMENTTSTIFSQDFVVDSIGFNDRNYINVNAHELAHQWFGDLITAQSGKHHWLQEGFATYYALLAERHLFGDDYFYEALNDYAQQLKRASKTDSIPVMNEKASSLSFYKKGAWALHVLREDIGTKNFQKAVKKYLKKYKYKNVNTDDFLKIVKDVSGYDVENFKKVWLETSGFEMEIAQKYLFKNKFLQEYYALRKSKKSLAELTEILKSDAYYPIKQYIVYQTIHLPFDERKVILESALATNDVLVRRAVTESTAVIPEAFKLQYESLLNDNSYVTKEIALVNLCTNFPEEREKYLFQMRRLIGNNDKSLRITWLKLAYETPEFENQRLDFYLELLHYASAQYESSIRQNALETLLSIDFMNKKVITQLFLATQHHKWQFTLFARTKIREFLKNPEYRKTVETIAETSDETMKELYFKFLNEKL
ncbi:MULTISPECIES: M1 family metallopeptidase [unclassified Flavobacterium]|uniref:M1 family metallopeptidase n=1 Tax=unclassified Flavobacterium TaxID=196869 RepID=UPI0012910E5C|nr:MULTISPECIES: M1 family metallopeptidase [unclassified Flavobacterium]MQP52838.1 M1 family peptidase [Flavobacterium sp. LMO9]MQP63112.1 M1 family peptidase [Flavobacterium sp. LMO6]